MLVRESINETIKHLAPRSDEEVWQYYLELINTSGNPVGDIDQYPDGKIFIKVSEKIGIPLSEMYMITDESNYDDLNEIFRTIVDGEECEWIREEAIEDGMSGDWQCFPSVKLAYWINDDMNSVNAWVFSRKFFETFKINEGFDSPGAKAKFGNVFSKEDMRDMTYPEPYKNLFQHGAYHGKDSGDLNVKINDIIYGKERDSLGAIEGLYRILIKKIPELKSFKIEESSANKTEKLHLRKESSLKDEVSNEIYKIEMNLWITYHLKNDNIFNYQKGKILLLFSNNIESKTFKRNDEPEIGKKLPSFSIGDINDEEIDNDLPKSYQGIPDAEDRLLIEKTRIYYKNLNMNSFLKLIPKIENNIEKFQKHIQEKYELTL